MPKTIKQLQKERDQLLEKRRKEIEKQELRREVFRLKHSKKIAVAKAIGSGAKIVGSKLRNVGENFAENFSKRERKEMERKRRKKRIYGSYGYKQDLGVGSMF